MKKIPVAAAVSAVLLALVTLTALSGCTKKPASDTAAASQRTESNRLNIYCWTYYVPLSVREKFEAEYNVTIIFDEYDSNESMYTKIQAGGGGYDIVFPSGDYVSIMINQGMFERIDKSKLSNLGNIDPLVLEKTIYDKNMDYSVPYYFGAAGIAVNTDRVPAFEKSWSIFSRSDLRGRMTMLDDMREVMGDALVHLGHSVNSKNPVEIAAAQELINTSWKPNLVKFDAEAPGKGFATGDFWVIQGYAEMVYEEITEEQKASTQFFIPPEGGPAYIDSMCILKGAKNIDLAHKFIDFIHRPEIYAEFTDYFGFPATVNVPARALKTVTPYYTAEELLNTELKDDLGEELELYNDVWFNSIRVGE
ncbi:MAG: extracellular solute-binding protein [Spirochaetaceae bacterium]|jgi:spermidine/putrescine transport system substrate-binding protein|nr:extracellular solute-binding protein [Spirochaetaceae bacterium]